LICDWDLYINSGLEMQQQRLYNSLHTSDKSL
jgi:hypothetical protein